MNGISCIYKMEQELPCDDGLTSESSRSGSHTASVTVPSVELFGQNDSPQRTRVLVNSDPITAITVKSGGWVDSIQFQRKSGAILKLELCVLFRKYASNFYWL